MVKESDSLAIITFPAQDGVAWQMRSGRACSKV